MIARLSGRLVGVERDAVVLDVGGVGFRVFLSGADLARAGVPGESLTLHTYLHVRDSELSLYGSVEPGALDLFQAFLSVGGVGPKVALALVGSGEPDELRRRVETQDIEALTRVPGVGKKTAQRIILDLKGKLPELDAAAPGQAIADEAVDALEALGYSRREAADALEGVEGGTVEERIRAALRGLAAG
jgi:Holliday junction DNA helicase RuvA